MTRARGREDAAHRYADAGWPVFPCQPGDKKPATPHGFLDATTSHTEIRQWWRSDPRFNLGIATGAPGPDVLDVDVRKGGTGYGPLRELKQAGLVPQPMAIVRTPSTGAHLYYQGTEQRGGHLERQHLDFRSQGGYVVASPSRIADRTYEVLRHQPSDATFDWGAAKGLLDPQPQRQPYQAPERSDGRPQSLDHLVRYVAECGDHVNDRLFWAACRMAEAGQEDRLPELIQAAYTAGEDRRGQAERTVESALRTTRSDPGRSFAPETGRTSAAEQRTAIQPDRFLEHSSDHTTSAAARSHPQAEAEAGALAPACKRSRPGVPPPNGSLIPAPITK